MVANIVYRNTETADTLNDKVARSVQDDDEGVPPPTLYECQSYFKRISDFTLAQNNSELFVDADKWQENKELFYVSCFFNVIKRFCFQIILTILFAFIMHQYRKQMIVLRYGQFCLSICHIRPPAV